MRANITFIPVLFLKLTHHYAQHNSISYYNDILITPNILFFSTEQIYFYVLIAEISLHIGILSRLGRGVEFLSGVFVGGCLMTSGVTPFIVLPAVAVATKANQIVAESMSGVLSHLRCDNHCCTRLSD